MKRDHFCKTMLVVIAMLLAAIAFRPLISPSPVAAQSDGTGSDGTGWLFFEPGVTTIRSPDNRTQVLGKVVVDLRNGNVWGYPTLQNDPYPRDPTQTKPQVSNPLYLGRYNLEPIRAKGE